MVTAYSVVEQNNLRTIFLMTIFLGLVFGLGYIFSYFLENRAIFYGAVVFGVLINLLSLSNS